MHARNTLSCPTVFFFQGITLTYLAQKKVVRLTGIPLGCPGPAWNSTPKGKSGCGTLMLCFQGRDDENSIPYLMSQKSSPYTGTFIKPKRKPQNLMELADEQDQRIMHLQKTLFSPAPKLAPFLHPPQKFSWERGASHTDFSFPITSQGAALRLRISLVGTTKLLCQVVG